MPYFVTAVLIIVVSVGIWFLGEANSSCLLREYFREKEHGAVETLFEDPEKKQAAGKAARIGVIDIHMELIQEKEGLPCIMR